MTALAAGLAAAVIYLRWLWSMDAPPLREPVDAGLGLVLPLYSNGRESTGWWAMVVLLTSDATVMAAFAFAYLFLWTARPGEWLPEGLELPGLVAPG